MNTRRNLILKEEEVTTSEELQEVDEEVKAISLSRTVDAHLWGKQYVLLVAGELCY